MEVPARPIAVILDCAYAMDGGSIHASVRSGDGSEHALLLVQHALPESATPNALFGRLYFDGDLIPIRSESEAAIIGGLRTAAIEVPAQPPEQHDPVSETALVFGDEPRQVLDAIRAGPEAATRQLITLLVSWVESEEYSTLADR